MSGDEEVLAALSRIEEWLAIIAKAQLSDMAKVELADEKMARLYGNDRRINANTDSEVFEAVT